MRKIFNNFSVLKDTIKSKFKNAINLKKIFAVHINKQCVVYVNTVNQNEKEKPIEKLGGNKKVENQQHQFKDW